MINMKIKTSYPGQDEAIIDAPKHIEACLRTAKYVPFNEPFNGMLKDDHGMTLVYMSGELVAIKG